MLGKFVKLNQELSVKFADRFPGFCLSDRELGYKEELVVRVQEARESMQAKKLLDAGANTRPVLPRDERYTLTGLDIEYNEECEGIYDKFIVQSIEDPLPEKQDLIYSKALMEHVPNNKRSFTSIFNGLNPGGETHHYMPCKGHPYALCLRLVGSKLQGLLIKKLRPEVAEGITGFPTYFSYCTPRQMRKLLKEIGFLEVSVEPRYRANVYFHFFFPLYLLVTSFENLCKGLNWEYFSSGMHIRAKKPAESSAS